MVYKPDDLEAEIVKNDSTTNSIVFAVRGQLSIYFLFLYCRIKVHKLTFVGP